MAESDQVRLSVSIVDVTAGGEDEFRVLARQYEKTVGEKGYGRAEIVRDEALPLRFYVSSHWIDATAAQRCQADPDIRAIITRFYQVGRLRHVVRGAHPDAPDVITGDRRFRAESDRRSGFDRRVATLGPPPGGDRRTLSERRIGPRRLKEGSGEVDLVAAARRAREYADAAFSKFKVGAALETADGVVITGCNVENATYGLTICAERVAMFKALSEGHRAFTRIAIVADTEAPTPPCGACRQILWVFGGNLEIILANLARDTGTHRLQDLLPLPFDARLL